MNKLSSQHRQNPIKHLLTSLSSQHCQSHLVNYPPNKLRSQHRRSLLVNYLLNKLSPRHWRNRLVNSPVANLRLQHWQSHLLTYPPNKLMSQLKRKHLGSTSPRLINCTNSSLTMLISLQMRVNQLTFQMQNCPLINLSSPLVNSQMTSLNSIVKGGELPTNQAVTQHLMSHPQIKLIYQQRKDRLVNSPVTILRPQRCQSHLVTYPPNKLMSQQKRKHLGSILLQLNNCINSSLNKL